MLVLLAAPTAYAQFWPMPGKNTAVKCTGCVKPTTDKLTYPYKDPLVRFVGRYVDSSSTGNYQNSGMRTVRARTIRTYDSRNRIFVQMGEMAGFFDVRTFFTTKLAQPLVTINSINMNPNQGWSRLGNPYEKVQLPDRFFYAESRDSTWTAAPVDAQRMLMDADMDDRGYVYATTIANGWGIGKDDGTNTGGHVEPVVQMNDSSQIVAKIIFAIKANGNYYAVLSETQRGAEATQIFNVTTPATPASVGKRTGMTNGIKNWAKYDAGSRVAVIHTDGRLAIYDYAGLLNGTALSTFTPRSGKTFTALTFDESGRVWATEAGSIPDAALLWKYSPSGSSYSATSHDVYGENFGPVQIHAAAGYIAIVGGTGVPPNMTNDVKLFKVAGGVPSQIDVDKFFGKYYHRAPDANHTAQADFNPSYYEAGGVQIVEYNGKTYLMYSAGGLGDVFELESGDSVSVSTLPGPYGTANPYAQSTEEGPFYGDILKFKGTSSSALAPTFTLEWDFANIESGALNEAISAVNAPVPHQFTGLSSQSKITQTKNVTAEVAGDPSIAGSVPVTLKVPKPRITIPGGTTITASGAASFEAVPGEVFKDASDGVVEGHFATWTIDNAGTPLAPNVPMAVGALGTHTLAFSASYGTYDPTTFAITSPYVASLSNLSYTVKPFVTSPIAQTTTGTNYTFSSTARYSASALTATQWTVTWTLEAGGAAGNVQAQESSTVAVGTVPPFVIAKSAVQNGNRVKLQISVDPSTVPSATYATVTQTYDISIPVIGVNIVSGCENAGEDCKLVAVSLNNGSTANWNISWSVKRGLTEVAAGTGLNITFKPTQEGSYTATATETSFGVGAQKTFSVAATICGPVPEDYQVGIGDECGGQCTVNVPVRLNASIIGYTVQPCDTLTWDFGDSTAPVSGKAEKASVLHTYTRNGTFRPKFTIKNNNNQRTWEGVVQVGGSSNNDCTLPTGISITYTGTKGCTLGGAACKTSESVKFTALRNGAGLSSCDGVRWTFDGTDQVTTRTPSKTFAAGQHTVTVVVYNTVGEAQPVSITLNVTSDNTGCDSSYAQEHNVSLTYSGAESGCSQSNTTPCKLNENITFGTSIFGYTLQACDKFDWSFGDTSTSTSREPTKKYTTQKDSYKVTLKISNTSNPGGTLFSVDVPFATVPVKAVPELEFTSFPSTASKNATVTFAVRVKNDVNATGWIWDFGDQSVDTSQSSNVGRNATITHTYTRSATFNVSVRARNSEDSATATSGQAAGQIKVEDVPEYRYVLPVVAHGPGRNNSVWRTDVQIYNPDPNASTKPLDMTASFRGVDKTLRVTTSTFIYEDFMNVFTNGNDQGSVLISARTQYAPQIWTRTYNVTETGTFGQFIPAIRLDNAGGGAAVGEGKYYMAGLRNDVRYRTNLGLVNPNAQTITANVRIYDDQGLQLGSFPRQLGSFQLDQFPITDPTAAPNLKSDRPFSVEIEVPAGQWVIAYASLIDGDDPVFMQAIRESEFSSADYRNTIIPGVGHIGQWRSDVTIYNPNGRTVPVDLAYYDQTGTRIAEAKAVPVGAGEFLQYNDLLKEGIFGSISAESLGVLRVTVPDAVSADRFPMTFARTYNDNGSGKTYGQGITGFATGRANVKPNKPALIAGIRSDASYYTNVGLTNVSDVDAVVKVKRLDPSSGAEMEIQSHTIKPNQSVVARIDLGVFEKASLKIETTGGNVWAFCSIVDKGTADPEYVAATPLQ